MRRLFNCKAIPVDFSANDFAYLPEQSVYFDSACQSLRPQVVLSAMQDYYKTYNSCGERVQYDWGKQVDRQVNRARQLAIDYLGLSSKDYFASFTLNTTYGLNLILNQLSTSHFRQIITSDFEHNSVFLSTMALAQKSQLSRLVVNRQADGSLLLDDQQLDRPIVVVNAMNNFDGRQLVNLQQLVKQVHRADGLVIIDAAQAMSAGRNLLQGVKADAICFSAHKMYGPSLGVMVASRSLINHIETNFIGGGMVDDVTLDDYQLSAQTNSDHIHTIFEAGLQPYAQIVGFATAIQWLSKQTSATARLLDYSRQLTDFLANHQKIKLINNQSLNPSTILSFYHTDFSADLLAKGLSDTGIMVRSGYFCVHSYLKNVQHYPPLVRLSLGLHNRQSDIDKLISHLKKVAN